MTVINAIRDVFTLPASGITDGARPVLSYNYGAGQMQRVRAGIRFMSAAAMVYTFCAWLFAMFQPRLLCRIFTPDEAMVEASVRMLRVYFAGFFFQSFQFCGQSVFQSLGWAKYAITFSPAAQGGHRRAADAAAARRRAGHDRRVPRRADSPIAAGGFAAMHHHVSTAYKQMGRGNDGVHCDSFLRLPSRSNLLKEGGLFL